MSEGFDLKSKRKDYGYRGVHFFVYPEKDVEEFIRRIKKKKKLCTCPAHMRNAEEVVSIKDIDEESGGL